MRILMTTRGSSGHLLPLARSDTLPCARATRSSSRPRASTRATRGPSSASPGHGLIAELPDAVTRVLGDAAFRERARGIAGAVEALPTVDAALDTLVAIAADGLRTPADLNAA